MSNGKKVNIPLDLKWQDVLDIEVGLRRVEKLINDKPRVEI